MPGKCIVTLGKLVAPVKTAQTLGLKRTFHYPKVLNGFAVPLTPSQPTLVRSVSTPATAPAASVLRHSEFGRHTTFGSDAPGKG